MTSVDWAIVLVYALGVLVLGLYFSRRAGRSMKSYFLGSRKLPWWVLGFSSAASASGAGAAPAFTMLVFTGGLLGNYVWWIPWIVWTPIVAIFWARFWRRLGLTTTAEFIEVRYGGRGAAVYRVIYAIYMVVFAILMMAYTTSFIREAFTPILHLDPIGLNVAGAHFTLAADHQIILGCGLVVVIYVTAAGLLGAVYSDVPQFIIFMAGNLLLIPIMLSRAGGLSSVYHQVEATRGSSFFDGLPPSPEIPGILILALVIQGLFSGTAPTAGEGVNAQRFLAAKNEAHAQLGQIFNAVLSLFVRTLPFFFFGIVGAALYPASSVEEPALIWGMLVDRFSIPGLTGILVAAELAAYMAAIDTGVNWGASYLMNDIYCRYLRRNAPERHYVAVSRWLSVAIFVIAVFTAFFIEGMRDWFLFINSVMISFMLPLSWLRFFWWRLNIYGEAVGVLGSLPLGFVVWFVLGFKDQPLWQAFLLLFGLGMALIILTTLLTPPESRETLRKFYLRCKPPGLWSPIAAEVSEEQRRQVARANRGGLTECFLSVGGLGLASVAATGFFAGQWALGLTALTASSLLMALTLMRWQKRGLFSEL